MEENEVLFNKLDLVIKSGFTKYEVSLKGFKQILNFFKNEFDQYSSVENASDPIVSIRDNFSRFLKELDQFHNSNQNIVEITLIDNWNRFNKILRNETTPQGHRIFYSKTSQFAIIKKIHAQNASYGLGSYEYFCNNSVPSDKNRFLGYTLAAELDLGERAKILKRSQIEFDKISQLTNELSQKSLELETEYNNNIKLINGWKEKFIEDNSTWQSKSEESINKFISDRAEQFENITNSSIDSMSKLESDYKEKLKYEGPVQEWTKRVKRYRTEGIIWVSLLSATVIGLIVLLYNTLYNLPEAFKKKLFQGDPEAIKGIILFGTIISFGAYLTKIFSKMTFSSFHIQRDAEEREKLTMVYLALRKDGDVSKEERQLIIQSLFSRVDSGLLKDDGAPTMPGLGQILDKTISR